MGFEILRTQKIAFLQFGLMYSYFSISMLFTTWIILKAQGRFASGGTLGINYSFVLILLLLGFIIGNGFIETYILHKYTIS